MILRNEHIKENCIKRIATLPFCDPPFEVVIKEHKSKRSISQNNLYWKWLQEIAEQATTKDGECLSKEKWHYLCALKYIGVDTIQDDQGKVFAVPAKSTTKLTVKEFTDYLQEIEAEFTRRGVLLSFPEDYSYAMGMENHRHGG